MFPGFPSTAVVVLVGISGSGKSTWARAQFPGAYTLSSDTIRGILTDSEEHQECSPDAFKLLEQLVELRLKYKRLAVVDATNLKRQTRRRWLELARKHNVPAVLVWFDTPAEVCARRQLKRSRRVPAEVIAKQARALNDLRKNLLEEDWDAVSRVHVGHSEDNAEALYVETLREWLPPTVMPAGTGGVRINRSEFDIIGDIHGCSQELVTLLHKLGWEQDDKCKWRHPQDRYIIFVGDLCDRGPDSLGVLEIVHDIVSRGLGLLIMGNHDDKLRRWLRGNSVKVTHGLETTVAEFSALEPTRMLELKALYRGFLAQAPLWALCDPQMPSPNRRFDDRVVVSHAAWKPSMISGNPGRVRSYCLYGPTTGNIVNGLPQRLDWKLKYPQDAPLCVVGHTAFKGPVVERLNTICLDTACVFGGALTAMRWPSKEIVQVPAARTYHDKGELASSPNLVNPDTLQPSAGEGDGAAKASSGGLSRDLPALEMVEVEPGKGFELRIPKLMEQIHGSPQAVLQRVHEDPKLLKRQPTDGPLKALTLANASKLLFSPETPHQIYAKGLIYMAGPAWKLVSLPYLKMYNYGERRDAFDLANELAARDDVTVRFNEKLDGTMIQLFSTAGLGLEESRSVITTRGMIEGGRIGQGAVSGGSDGVDPSHHSNGMFDYLGQARAILTEQSPKVLDPEAIKGWTLLWEMIHPKSRIVTDYGERKELVLTGAVDMRQGAPRYIPRDELEALGERLGAPVAHELALAGESLEERLEALAAYLEGTDHEGAVLTFEGRDDAGRPVVLHRVKVKGADYLRLMRLFAYCTYDRTREFLEANPSIETWPQLREFLMRQGSDEVPEEVLGAYKAHFNVWLGYRKACQDLLRDADAVYQQRLVESPMPSRDDDPQGYKDWRRAYAKWVKTTAGAVGWLFFSLADGKLTMERLHERLGGDAEAVTALRSDFDAIFQGS